MRGDCWGEGVRALVLIIVFVGVGLNSLGDPDVNFSCWGLLLHEEARLVVRLSGEEVTSPGVNQG